MTQVYLHENSIRSQFMWFDCPGERSPRRTVGGDIDPSKDYSHPDDWDSWVQTIY